nr:(2Fe-2S)-binding protein [Rhodococcus sp. LB1]
MTDVTITLEINGQQRTVTAPARTTLADMLRDQLGLTGVHLGCEQGVCGACTVLLDDLPVRSCLTLAASCDGSEIVTIEGLAGDDIDRLRNAFSTEGGLQCGFCTAGMLISGLELVRRRQEMTREQTCIAMSGNICRCTGYNGIIRAVEQANIAGIAAEESACVPHSSEPATAGSAPQHTREEDLS